MGRLRPKRCRSSPRYHPFLSIIFALYRRASKRSLILFTLLFRVLPSIFLLCLIASPLWYWMLHVHVLFHPAQSSHLMIVSPCFSCFILNIPSTILISSVHSNSKTWGSQTPPRTSAPFLPQQETCTPPSSTSSAEAGCSLYYSVNILL